jgi:hypothetical protein
MKSVTRTQSAEDTISLGVRSGSNYNDADSIAIR